jgi:hypothetical protein
MHISGDCDKNPDTNGGSKLYYSNKIFKTYFVNTM